MPFTRREFLGFVGVLAGSRLGSLETNNKRCRLVPHERQIREPPAADPTTNNEQRRFVLHECFIAGFRFHGGLRILPSLHVGDAVKLVAEPGNPHDPWAVRIEHHKGHLGYLPRDQNQPISRLLQQDVPIACRITAVNEEAVPWKAVRVQASLAMDGAGLQAPIDFGDAFY